MFEEVKQLREKAAQIVQYLSPWELAPVDPRVDNLVQFVNAQVEGPAITLRLRKGRISFAGRYPHSYYPADPAERAYITVSASRDPKSIAGDMQRRLLPQYRTSYAAAVAQKEADEAYQRRKREALETLAEISQMPVSHHNDREPQIYHYAHPSGTLAQIKIRTYALDDVVQVDLDLGGIPFDVAKQLCQVLSTIA
jgi:hypothetical protein